MFQHFWSIFLGEFKDFSVLFKILEDFNLVTKKNKGNEYLRWNYLLQLSEDKSDKWREATIPNTKRKTMFSLAFAQCTSVLKLFTPRPIKVFTSKCAFFILHTTAAGEVKEFLGPPARVENAALGHEPCAKRRRGEEPRDSPSPWLFSKRICTQHIRYRNFDSRCAWKGGWKYIIYTFRVLWWDVSNERGGKYGNLTSFSNE